MRFARALRAGVSFPEKSYRIQRSFEGARIAADMRLAAEILFESERE
jgi:hypothetical protein